MGEVRVVEEAGGTESFDGRVDVGDRLAFLDQQPTQLGLGAHARLEHVEGAIVGRTPWFVGLSHREVPDAAEKPGKDRPRRNGRKERTGES